MDSGRQSASVDWTSRILAVVGLVIAMCAGGYVISQGQVATKRDDLVKEFQQALQKESTEYAQQRAVLENEFQKSLQANDERMQGWNDQIVAALNKFEADAQTLVNQIADAERSASQERSVAFRQEIAALQQLADLNDKADPETTSVDVPNETDDSEKLATAKLTVTESVMRPANGDFTLIRIENNSREDALIHRLRFRPEADFRVESAESLTEAGTDTVTTLVYSTADNTSTKPGHHGIYDRTLTDPIRVPAGKDITFRVVIDDASFVGWGFAGKLMLEYNSKEPLVVKSARVRFDKIEAEVSENDELIDQST